MATHPVAVSKAPAMYRPDLAATLDEGSGDLFIDPYEFFRSSLALSVSPFESIILGFFIHVRPL